VNNQPSNLSNTLGGYKRLLKPRVGYRMVVLSSTLRILWPGFQIGRNPKTTIFSNW